MLLIEAVINGTTYYVSDEAHRLTHNWRAFVQKFDSPMWAPASDHGGFCTFRFGNIRFDAELFSSWPPPITITLTAYYSATTEEAKVKFFSGVAYLKEFGLGYVEYTLKGPAEYDETVPDSTAYNDTLVNVITTILTGIAEISTVDTTYARSPSPEVIYTTSGEDLNINLASNISEFFTHAFYIDGSTAYLIDMLEDRGSSSLTEFQYFEKPKYWYKSLVAEVKTEDYSRYSTYLMGDVRTVTAYHTVEENINDALDNIITVENRPRITIGIPFDGTFPAFGEKISFSDTADPERPLSSWFRQRVFRYDFVRNRETPILWLEGEGFIQ